MPGDRKDEDCARELQKIFVDRLKKMEPKLPGDSLRESLYFLACGKVKTNPFPEDELEELRWDLRLALKKWGFGDGLPLAGDRVQALDTRLMQGLLMAMGDPDHYFMEWWSTGGWLGSKDHKLPRARVLYDRKVK